MLAIYVTHHHFIRSSEQEHVVFHLVDNYTAQQAGDFKSRSRVTD